MKTIKFYIPGGKYLGWKKLKSFSENWLVSALDGNLKSILTDIKNK